MARSAYQSRRGLKVLAALAAAGAVWALAAFLLMTQPSDPGSRRRVFVNIPPRTSMRGMGEILQRRGVVRSGAAFVWLTALSPPRRAIAPGVYELSPGMTPPEVLRALVSGRMAMASVTFPEGFTVEQIADLLARRGLVDRGAFLTLCREHGRTLTAPRGFVPPDDNLEGYLFPDTYRFRPDSNPRTVATEMLGNFERHVVLRHPEVADWREPTIVASLVEREARVAPDRPLIAGVIRNRLHKGMRLQIDATVQYALPAHKARLMYADLKTRSPYNTYLHAGLPPTPICCPGLACLEAALAPTPSNYLFYVSGPGDKHIFSSTLAEHDAIRRRLRSGGAQ